MTQCYRRLFSIACRHDYFADPTAPPLSLVPTAACAQVLRRYGLLFRPAPAGATVLYSDAALLAQFKQAEPLAFMLVCSDPTLLNYTEADFSAIPATWSGTGLADLLFYTDNLAAPTGALRPDFKQAPLPHRAPRFVCSFGAPVGGARLDVIDRLSGQSVLRIDAPADAGTSMPLNLDGLVPGRYGLRVDGVQEQDFYLDGGAVMLGVVAVYPGGAAQAPFMDGGLCVLDAHGHIVADNADAPVYTLNLASRQTRLRYRIYSAGADHQLDNWHIAAKPQQGQPGLFLFDCTRPTQAGEPWIYGARQALPLQQVPDAWSFTLTPLLLEGRRSTHGNTLRLPYARGDVLPIRDADSPCEFWSDVYVYL